MITDDNYHRALDELEKLILLDVEGKLSPEEVEQLNVLILGLCKYEQDLLAGAFEPFED